MDYQARTANGKGLVVEKRVEFRDERELEMEAGVSREEMPAGSWAPGQRSPLGSGAAGSRLHAMRSPIIRASSSVAFRGRRRRFRRRRAESYPNSDARKKSNCFRDQYW
jgi:hypothetical protein